MFPNKIRQSNQAITGKIGMIDFSFTLAFRIFVMTTSGIMKQLIVFINTDNTDKRQFYLAELPVLINSYYYQIDNYSTQNTLKKPNNTQDLLFRLFKNCEFGNGGFPWFL